MNDCVCARALGERFQRNFVHDSATLMVAFDRAADNREARAPGVDDLTATDVEESIGVPGFLNDLRAALKDNSFGSWSRTVPAACCGGD